MLSDLGVPMLLWLYRKVDGFQTYLWYWIDVLDVHDQANL